jgi:hypothetical protein
MACNKDIFTFTFDMYKTDVMVEKGEETYTTSSPRSEMLIYQQ